MEKLPRLRMKRSKLHASLAMSPRRPDLSLKRRFTPAAEGRGPSPMDSKAGCISANRRPKRASLRARYSGKLWSRTKPDRRVAWSTKCWWRNQPRSRAKFTLRFCSIARRPGRWLWPARKAGLKLKRWRRSRPRKLFASRSIRWPACNCFRHANWRSS